ncbi:MAG: secG [Rickettsiaceae bacterium]|jgi:preprotein translocase subunit SecG|nr:secG [Rickettsiaceae bacterium]
MLDIFLIVHIVIAILLITVILLQKSSTDGLASLGGGGNSGVMTAKTAANFMTKLTVVLATLFLMNSILLANLSTKKHTSIIEQAQEEKKQDNDSLPVAQ